MTHTGEITKLKKYYPIQIKNNNFFKNIKKLILEKVNQLLNIYL